jgi:polyisoprenoid-binding protein YceI
MKLVKLIISILVIILILAFAAVSVGYFRSHAHAAEPHRFSSDAASHETSTAAADRYQLDSSQSKFIAHAMAGGLLWFEGHDHLVAVKDFSGEAQFSPDQLNQASLQMTAKAASMIETSSVFTDQQKQIIDKELREMVLQPDQFPDIIFRSTHASKFKRERRKLLGWTLFLSGLASTIPIAMHVFGKKDASASAH